MNTNTINTKLQTLPDSCVPSYLLTLDGYFLLEEVAKILNLSSSKLKKIGFTYFRECFLDHESRKQKETLQQTKDQHKYKKTPQQIVLANTKQGKKPSSESHKPKPRRRIYSASRRKALGIKDDSRDVLFQQQSINNLESIESITPIFPEDVIHVSLSRQEEEQESIILAFASERSKEIEKEPTLSAVTTKEQKDDPGILYQEGIWYIHMPSFSSYYLTHLCTLPTKHVDPSWDGNELLKQNGIFYLHEVVQKIPFNDNQLRYKAKRINSREITGMFKEDNNWKVDISVFSQWITKQWRGT